MKQLTIGIDLDGVISYGGALKKEYIKKYFKRDCPNPSKFTSGLTDKEYKKMIADLYDTDEYLRAPMIPKADFYLNKLKEDGHKIIIITRRTNNQMPFALKWLKNHNINYEEIINTSDNPKTDACKKINPDIFIDDYKSAKEELKGIVPHILIFNPEDSLYWDKIYPKIVEIAK